MLKTYGAVFGERFGTGPPEVLALHGWGRDRTDFQQVLQGLDAVAVDLPGFGASPPPAEALGAAGYATVLSPVLDDFVKPPIVLGHSFGGRVAIHVSLEHATRALVLAGVPLVRTNGAPQPSLRFRLLRSMHRAGMINDERMERSRQRHGSTDYRTARGVMRDVLVRVLGESYEDELPRLTCPVELVWGSQDHEVPVAVAERALSLLADGHLTVLAGVGHIVPREAPAELRALVEATR